MNYEEVIENYFASHDTSIGRDLKLNLKKLLDESPLGKIDSFLTVLATGKSLGNKPLVDLARNFLVSQDLTKEQIQEAEDSAGIMGMLNTYYRFRHMVNNEEYKIAGLRMTSLARPLLGKERFESLAFAVSVINGCESCIRSHEEVLRGHGLESSKIHDLAKIAAVVKGITSLASLEK